MARISKQQKLDRIHREAIDRFSICETREEEQRKLAVEDMRFANDEQGQWDEDAIEKRKDRPRYTINKVAGAIDQLIGDQRQTQTMIKVRPASGGADEDTAKILNGIILNIQNQSKADNSFDNAANEMFTGGYGGWRVNTKFNDDDLFEQDITVEPINSAATSLWFDPDAETYDKRDAQFAFLTGFISKAKFKDRFPKAQISDWDQITYNNSSCRSWFKDDSVRVAEYWVKQPITKTIGLLSDGRIIDVDEEAQVIDDLVLDGITLVKQRKVKSHKVVMYLISGGEVLRGPMDWAGKYIPLIPCYGKTITIEGKTYVRGLVRNAKDPSRIYNYATSAAIEAAALTPKDPYWVTGKQANGYEVQFKTFNKRNQPFMFYNPDEKAPGPPQRTGAPSVQSAFLAQIQQASQDIHATTGLEPASMGNVPELKSGKAIIAQQKMGDRGAFVFTDNLNKSKEYTGEILVDLIPKVMDTARYVRTLNLDGSSEEVAINQQALDEFGEPVTDAETGEQVMVNDITVGKYDVVVDTGPSYATKREESARQLVELSNGNPAFGQLAMDLIAKNLDLVEGGELTSRVRKMMIQQGTIQPTENEAEEMGLNQPQQPDPMQVAMLENLNMQTAKTQSDIENKDADTENKMADTASKVVKAQQDVAKTLQIMVDTVVAKVGAGIPITLQERDLLIKQRDMVAESQQFTDPGPNSEQIDQMDAIINQAVLM